MTRTSDGGGANPIARVGPWVVPRDESMTVGARGSNADIVLPSAGTEQFASVRWNGKLVELRALSEHSRPIVDGRPTLFKRVAVGESFTIADHVFTVSGPAELSLLRAATGSRPSSPKAASHDRVPRGTGAGKQWRLTAGQPTTIGREGGDADIQLRGLELAQRHATVSWTGRLLELRAVAAQPRPFVGGKPVLHARIPVGGQFMVGQHTFVVSNPAEVTLVVPAVTAEPVLRVCDVSLQYRGKTVPQLKSVSFELRPGEVLAVIGPSGAGKSTMCGGLLGEVRMVGGAMSLAGVDLAQSRTQASHLISFVPQQPAMFRDLTVRESLSYVANMRLASDMRAPERAARVTEVIAAMALTADADKPIKDLSGGQLKRASTAMELLSTPVLLILDEPTSGLDEGLDRAMMETLKIAADKDGLAVIVITHSMVNLDKVDKVLALTGQGRPAFLGPPGELLSAFGVTSFAAAMDALRADKRVPVPAVSAPTAAPAVDVTPSRPLKGSMRNHLRELIRRELSRMWIARKANVQLLAVGVLGTALLTLVASPEGLRGDPTAISATLITFIVCMAFFSMVPSFSAIVDDRDVVEREARWSVSATSVIISRALTCALVAVPLSFVTTASYVLLTWNKRPVDPLLPHPAGLFLFAILLAVAAMCVGLLISAVSRSLRAAVFVLMSVLALHVVLTGLAPQFVGSTAWFMKDIAAFVPSRWASGGLGADYGLTQSRPAPTGAGGATSIPSPFADAIWTHDTWHIWQAVIGLVGIAIASLVAAAYFLKRQLLSTK